MLYYYFSDSHTHCYYTLIEEITERGGGFACGSSWERPTPTNQSVSEISDGNRRSHGSPLKTGVISGDDYIRASPSPSGPPFSPLTPDPLAQTTKVNIHVCVAFIVFRDIVSL